jgi:hypothetical protein
MGRSGVLRKLKIDCTGIGRGLVFSAGPGVGRCNAVRGGGAGLCDAEGTASEIVDAGQTPYSGRKGVLGDYSGLNRRQLARNATGTGIIGSDADFSPGQTGQILRLRLLAWRSFMPS